MGTIPTYTFSDGRKITLENGVPFMNYPGGIAVELDPMNPELREIIRNLRTMKEQELLLPTTPPASIYSTECGGSDCEVKIKHFHCGCGRVLGPYPLGPEVERTVYAAFANDWHNYRFKRSTKHDVVSKTGEIIKKGRCTS